MLMYGSPHAKVLGQLVPNGLPTEKKAERRPRVDLSNEAQHRRTHEVSLARSEEKSAVDRPDPVCSSHIIIAQKQSTCITCDTHKLHA